MPASNPNPNASKARNFYEAAAGMAMGGPGGSSPAPKPAGAGDTGEKVSNVKALLEVFKKMDKLEADPEAKALIQRMSEIAQEYMQKVQGGGAGGAATAPAAGGMAPDAGMGPGAAAGPGAGGAGALPPVPPSPA